jgi:hypothetical protein
MRRRWIKGQRGGGTPSFLRKKRRDSRERAHLLAYGFFFLRLPFGYTVHTTVERKKEEKALEGFHFIQKRALSFHSQVCVCVCSCFLSECAWAWFRSKRIYIGVRVVNHIWLAVCRSISLLFLFDIISRLTGRPAGQLACLYLSQMSSENTYQQVVCVGIFLSWLARALMLTTRQPWVTRATCGPPNKN